MADYDKLNSIFGGIGSIGGLLTGLTGIITNALQGKKQREANLQAIRETNASNLAQVDRQNAAAAAESEKQRAYESAPAQVSRLRSAGMSKAGALGAINGAGGYTPAPVNAAQAQAPTQEYQPVDFSGITNALQGMAQLSMQQKQLKSSERIAADNLNEVRRSNDADIANKNANTSAVLLENAHREYVAAMEQVNLTENSEIKEYAPIIEEIALDGEYSTSEELMRLIRDKNKKAFDAVARYSELRSLVNAKVQLRNAERTGNVGAEVAEETKGMQISITKQTLSNLVKQGKLSEVQAAKIESEATEINNRIDEWRSPQASKARYYERSMRAIAAEMGYDLKMDDYYSFIKHRDSHTFRAEMRSFWDYMFDLVPVSTLGKIIAIITKK